MQCPQCQHENAPRAKFCEECATPLVRNCASCRGPISPTAKFCPECGHPVAAAAAPQSRFASPEAYTPKHLAERILTSKATLEGERKQVTVLFADMKGSMELLADRDPEEARKLLDPLLELMMSAVHHYEGTVNQVMGDGIMALFGAPLAHEDHAVRACYAALRMQEAVRRYAEEMRRREGVLPQIRVGLNSGEVVVRSVGNDLRMDYTAVGQTTHLASRMEQMAAAGSILVSADTLALSEGYVQVSPLGPTQIKGLANPVEVYEVTGAGSLRSRMEAAAARGLTRFVGRNAEREVLRQALDKARAGRGQIVALVGEPGVGKSRLFWEFIHSHRTHGWLVLESGTASYSKSSLYLPVIDLLKAYFQLDPRDDARKIREKVTGKIVSLDRALEPGLPAFLALLDVPVGDPQWEALDPPQRRQRTLEALKRLLLRESQVQPLGLALEDLHWIDSETQALLDSLVDSLPMARLLLLVNYRPEYQHGWGSRSYYTQLRIDPLPPESAEELLQSLLGPDPSVEPLKQPLIARTQGNPFFLEESIRTLVETQVLAGDRGAYRLVKAPTSVQVPATVQAVLAARIDRLPLEEKRLLQAAAVIGEEVPFSLLQAIADQSEEALHRGLADLQSAEFLYEARLFPELEYTFKHALTYQVTYGACCGLGHVYGIKGDFRHAVPLLERSVALCREWNLHFIAPSVTAMLGYVYTRSDRLPEALELLQQALASGESTGLTMFSRPAIGHLGEAHLLAGQPEEALALAGRALALAREHGQRGQEAWVLRLLGEIAGDREAPDAGTAEGNYRGAMTLADELGMRPLVAHCHLGLGRLYRRTASPETARDHFAASMTKFRELDMRFWLERAEAEAA